MHSLFVKEHLNTKCPKLGKISLAETLSRVTNSSILENPQFGRVSVVVAIFIAITSVIGELIFANVTALSDCRCPITTLHNDYYSISSHVYTPNCPTR